ncbi:hypothetical protein BWP39_13285 [Paraburkholderia acidicola]|uniref:DUF2844 domain-containing protein n=1 Tax=Paraburkholderia acidicola TaxID=1912599 RepID=A0A2A4EXA4_9BURK|nr:DUF2844 domain-containing protein [Paraburkholderia acidicola]PCE25495.1 hypothetical protein BWP39_13285 [Paraburkholderia acidicola]
MNLRIVCSAMAFAAAIAALPAHAELGGAPTWPAGTATSSAAASTSGTSSTSGTLAVRRLSANATTAYTVNTTTLTGGTVVREYVGSNGSVFAIAWQGPQIPGLATLLGTYFPGYVQSLNETRATRGTGFGAASVQRSDLVVQSGGHMGAFAGRAWLPPALPAGVSANDIQ